MKALPGVVFDVPTSGPLSPSTAFPGRAAPFLPAVVGAAGLGAWWWTRLGSSESWTGTFLVVVGLLLAWRGPATPTPTTTPASASTTTTSGSAAVTGLWVVGCALLVSGLVVDVRLVQAGGVVVVAFAAAARWSGHLSWAALLLVLLGLPLSGDVDVIGFPLRRLGAEGAARLLPLIGVDVVPAATVLVTENGVADVEAPCAGLATLRLLVALVLGLGQWWAVGPLAVVGGVVVAVVVAVVGNTLRIAALAALVLGADRPDLAALLHVPLGVVVFVVAAWSARPLLARGADVVRASPAMAIPPAGWSWPAAATSVAVAVAVANVRMDAPKPQADDDTALVERLHRLGPVAGPHASSRGSDGAPLPLSAAETELFARHALGATKRRLLDFDDPVGGAAGEVLVVVARSLRALHAPERCLAAGGHVVVDIAMAERGGVPVKRLLLDGGRSVGLSFLRSARTTATTTAEVAAARLRGDRGPWVFTSAVVAAGVDEDALVRSLVVDADALLFPDAGIPASAIVAEGAL